VSFIQRFDAVGWVSFDAGGWVTKRTSGPVKTCTTYPQRFSSGTSRGKKPRGNRMTQVNPEKQPLQRRKVTAVVTVLVLRGRL